MASPAFVPPPVSAWQGPAQESGGFVPPPPDSWEGPAASSDVYSTPGRKPGQAEKNDAILKRMEGEHNQSDSAASRFGTGLWNAVNPIPTLKRALGTREMSDISDQIKQGHYGPATLSALNMLVHGPGGRIADDIINSQVEQGKQAVDYAKAGRPSEAIGHGVAAAVPYFGPMAANLGEQAGGEPEMAPGKQVGPTRPMDLAGAAGTGTGLAAAAVAPAIAKGIKATVSGAGKVTAGALGSMTGEGPEAVKEIAKGSPKAMEAMRGGITEQDVLGDFQDALQNLKQARGDKYAAQLEKISASGKPPIMDEPIKAALDQKLNQFRVGRVPPKPEIPKSITGEQYQALQALQGEWQARYGDAKPGDLDFGGSPVGKEGQGAIREVNDLITNWKDWSPVGADALKRRLDDLYTPSGQARALVAGLKKQVHSSISQQVPDYADMTRDYAQSSAMLDRLKDLSLESKNPGTAIRKLATMLKQNNLYRQALTESLQPFAEEGVNLKGELAGSRMNSLYPRGLSAYAVNPIGILTALLSGHPGSLAYLALTSPRLVGELAAAAGKVSRTVPPVPIPKTNLPITVNTEELSSKHFPTGALKAFAQQNNVSEDEARKRLTAEGWTIQ